MEANGTVVANEYAELHPEVSGRVVYLDIPEGKMVTKGTVLARINVGTPNTSAAKRAEFNF